MRRKLCQRFEHLENRRLLAVTTEVISGDLAISGAAEGTVEIVSTGEGNFDIMEAGELVASVEGVNDDIRIDLSGSENDDEVIMYLDGADIDRVMVNLGDGSNRLAIESGETRGSVQYFGGADDDAFELGEDVVVGRSLSVLLRGGDNSADLLGTVNRGATISAGPGDDLIRLGENAEIARGLSIQAGSGANTTSVEGAIGGSLYYRGGVGDDLIDMLATSSVGGRSTFLLGSGDNSLNIDGVLGSHMNAFAGGGDDVVTIGEFGSVGGNARLRLGGGDNLLDNAGEITGRLRSDTPAEPPVELPTANEPAIDLATTLRLNDILSGTFEFNGTARMLS